MNSGSSRALRIVLLAAGFSTRLGQPKALARIHGQTLLERTHHVLIPYACGWPIITVVPWAHGRYRLHAAADDGEFVRNRRRAAGLSSSVRTGARRARYCGGILFLPVDLCELQGRDIERLIGRWRGAPRRVAANRLAGGRGTPLILPRWMFCRVAALRGDEGLRDVVRALATECISLLDMPSARFDVDTPADLAAARRRVRPGREPMRRVQVRAFCTKR